MNDEIIKCCERQPQIQTDNRMPTFIIRCESCETIVFAKDRQGAIEKWNKEGKS